MNIFKEELTIDGLTLTLLIAGILEEDRDSLDNSATLMAKYFYQSCMDMASIEEASDTPLREVVAKLGGWPVAEASWSEAGAPPLEHVVGLIKRNFTIGVLIEEWIGPDDKNSKSNIVQIDQMPLGLPSRDYFLHEESEKDLEAYHLYMTDVAELFGANRTEAQAQLWTVVKFEQLLANVSYPESRCCRTCPELRKTVSWQLLHACRSQFLKMSALTPALFTRSFH